MVRRAWLGLELRQYTWAATAWNLIGMKQAPAKAGLGELCCRAAFPMAEVPAAVPSVSGLPDWRGVELGIKISDADNVAPGDTHREVRTSTSMAPHLRAGAVQLPAGSQKVWEDKCVACKVVYNTSC